MQDYAAKLGYSVTVEKGSCGVRNIIIGDPETASYLVSAHYDTPARLPFPNLITPCSFVPFVLYQLLQVAVFVAVYVGVLMGSNLLLGNENISSVLALMSLWLVMALMLVGPANRHNSNDNTSGVVTLLEIARTMPENQRHKVCFVLFDLEEAGLLGSAAYRKAHKKASNSQLVLNLDCVGDGDHIRLFPTKALKKNKKKLTSLYKACGYFGSKDILVREKGFSVYPSDQRHFPYGVGICALKDSRFGLYIGKIHTRRDQTLEQTNVNILRAALTTFITCDN